MLKNGHIILFSMLIGIGLHTSSFATDVNNKMTKGKTDKNPAVKLADIAFIPLEFKSSVVQNESKDEKITKESSDQKSELRAAAPPLTVVQINSVGSSNCGWEPIYQGQTTTTCNHGGALLRVTVLELGYGKAPFAWMNGALLSNSTNYQTDAVCYVGGSLSNSCPSGYTIVGWLKYYNLDGYQSGLFKFQDTSTNSPWNTMSTQINIL